MSVNIDEYIDKAISEGRGWSDADREAYVKSLNEDDFELPLFAQTNEAIDPAVADALRAINEEGETPETLAEHHKSRGNTFFQKGRLNKMYFVHAAQSYTTALGYAEQATETEELNQLKSTLLSNRSMAHLMRKNLGSARRDAELALKFNPTNVKAHYRRAKACYELKMYSDCMKAAEAGLEIDADNTELRQILAKSQAKITKMEAKAQEIERKLQERAAIHDRVWDVSASRGYHLGYSRLETLFHPQHIEPLPTFDEDGSIAWPAVMFCPQYQQLDHVQQFNEVDMLALVMAALYPEEELLPWDEQGEYHCSNLHIYIQRNSVPRIHNLEEWHEALQEQQAYRGELGPEQAERVIASSQQRMRRHTPGNWLEIHPGCTLHQILQYPGVVMEGAAVVFHVYARNNKAHNKFLKEVGSSVELLQPEAANTK